MEFQFADLYEALTDAGPDAPVLVAGDVRCTRAVLDGRANQLAHHLDRSGITRGDRVAVYSHNRVEWVESLLACWKLGAAAVNVNYRYVEDELRYVLDDSEPRALIYERGLAAPVTGVIGDVPGLDTILVLEDDSPVESVTIAGDPYEGALGAASVGRGFAPRSGDDIHLLYTGGTTGMPKGVVWRHEDLYTNLARRHTAGLGGAPSGGIERPDQIVRVSGNPLGLRTLALAPLMHGGGQYPFIITTFNGGVSILSTDRTFDASRVLRLVVDEDVMTLNIIGDAMGRPLAEAALREDALRGDADDVGSLRAITSGGAVLSADVRSDLRAAFPGVLVTGGVGASEIGTAAFEVGHEETDGPRFKLAHDTAVLDEDLEPLGPGGVGRVARRGAIPLRYHGDPSGTGERFPVDRHGTRWVVPGDWARVEDDGTFVLLGRGSQCVNTGGEKVFPDEVENVLAGHPDVEDVIVVGAPDPTWQERVVALVAPRAGTAPSLDELQAHCRAHLAGYKVPRALVLGPLRRTEVGKPDYRWATQRAREL